MYPINIPYIPRGNYSVNGLRSPPSDPEFIESRRFNYPYGSPRLRRAGLDYEIDAISADFPRSGGTLSRSRRNIPLSGIYPYRSPGSIPGYRYTYNPGTDDYYGPISQGRLFGSGPSGWIGFVREDPDQMTYQS